MSKTISVVITLCLVLGIGYVLSSDTKSSSGQAVQEAGQNVEVRDGIQYVTIAAKGGYIPRTSTARAGLPTKLIIKTDGTYDCSSSLVISAIDYQKVLSPSGEEEVDIGIPEPGVPLKGTCSMGMYSFSVLFS